HHRSRARAADAFAIARDITAIARKQGGKPVEIARVERGAILDQQLVNGRAVGSLRRLGHMLAAGEGNSPHQHQHAPPDHATGSLTAEFAALRIALTLAAATSSSMPTPQTVRPSGVTHSR